MFANVRSDEQESAANVAKVDGPTRARASPVAESFNHECPMQNADPHGCCMPQ
jgi:hypothetical protein